MTFSRILMATTASVAVLPAPAFAGTANNTMGVSMTINAGCTVSAGTMTFGTQTSLQASVDQTATFTVTCTNTTPYSIGIDSGTNSASVTSRKMKGGASNTEFVSYNLYRDAARTGNWGTTAGSNELPGTGNGSAQTVTVYGRVPAQTIGSPGGYTDTVGLVVTY